MATVDNSRTQDDLLQQILRNLLELSGVVDLTPIYAKESSFLKVLNDAKPGDHIAVRAPNEIHWHHGIFTGEVDGKESVVDMWGTTIENAAINIREAEDFFFNKAQVYVVLYNDDTDERRAATLKVALSCARDSAQYAAPVYNLLSNNCECFATFCRTGRCVPSRTMMRLLRDVPPKKAPERKMCAF